MTTSSASESTQINMTLLDDTTSSNGGDSFAYSHHNGSDSLGYVASQSSAHSSSARSSVSSRSPSEHTLSTTPTPNIAAGSGMQIHKIFNYKQQDFMEYKHPINATCEDICLYFCRMLNILPTTRLLFALRVFDSEKEWAVPGKPLRADVRYCFRIRFKVPAQDTQLQRLDANAYSYLYSQMRYDMVHEHIPEIRYPVKKDSVVGLGVMDMYIDLAEDKDTVEHIESNIKRYFPRKLRRAHRWFLGTTVRSSFQQVRSMNKDLAHVRCYYVHEVHTLAPNYLMERFVGVVDYIPGEDQTDLDMESEDGIGGRHSQAQVYIKVDQYDSAEPGLKIARPTAEDKLKWVLVSKLEHIYALCIVSKYLVRLEITGLPGFGIRFDNEISRDSFITYVSGYVRLTSKWTVDLCLDYPTPSLQELISVNCHGPIGATFSFAKICEKNNKCGSYIIRQCEKEYDTYYIDINTRYSVTETFKITKDNRLDEWLLHCNNSIESYSSLEQLANAIQIEDTERRERIKPSQYDKPTLLLICLPRNLQRKKTEAEVSEADLQRKRAQIFFPHEDLLWYKNSEVECDNGKMCKIRADWVQQGRFKEVPVTLKTLRHESDFSDFMKLASTWGQIDSPQCLKFYGITLCTPYTMVLEYPEYGALNEFLRRYQSKVPVKLLLDIVLGLTRAIVYLQEHKIIHGYVRCSNMYVTKFDLKSNLLVAKLADPGFPRPYGKEDLPWLPFAYYQNKMGAKNDECTDYWAFATTVWEIFANGEDIRNLTADVLRRNYRLCGGILQKSDDCPNEMYRIMMDGWNQTEPRFNAQDIFSTLISIKEELLNNYASVESDVETISTSLPTDYELTNEDRCLTNGNSASSDMQDSTASGLSTTYDHMPLIRSQQQNGRHNLPLLPRGNYFDETNSVRQLPNGKVVYRKQIGEGHYGTVYLGELCYNSPNMEREQVAIKTLKCNVKLAFNKDFMREIQIMQSLDHRNIVKIKQWIDNPISIIMEYLEGGSFLVYLVSGKPNLRNESLLRFALDIANGMDYLRSKNIIHRDLAARNILVDRDSVKISDFGLAQVANKDGYYLAQSVREIPLKWYSPESIKTEKFSFQSDVWSYGVTLFEMFSRGEVPNLENSRELSHEEFLQRLERGERLRKPELCPDNVYEDLMMRCWHANPKMRPTFKDIVEAIQSITNANGNGF